MATGGSDSTATSDEIIHIKCCLCAEKNRKREAEKYCIDCKDYYCSSCVGIHKEIPFMKGHQVLDKADFQARGPDDSLPSYPVQRCKEHTTELLSIYCEDHDEVACAQCIAFSHRACKKIISIPEEIEVLYRNVKPDDIKLKLRQISKPLEEIRTSREVELKALDEMFDKDVASVNAFKQQLKELLDAAEKESIHELRNKYNILKTAVSDDIKTIESLVKSLSESVEQFQKYEGNMSQVFVSAKCSEKLIVKAGKLENDLVRKPTVSCKFIPNQDIMDCLGKNENLGEVSSFRETPEVDIVKNGLYTTKNKKQINVKLENDTNTCNIWGSCITEDGFLLLTDNNNKKLKRVDLNRENVSDYIDLQAPPYAVCTVSRTEAAVTLYDNGVVLLSLGDKMMMTRTLSMKPYCLGIACRDDKLYISDNSKTVYVYGMNDRMIRNVCKDTNARNIFASTRNIAVSCGGDKVYVADLNNGLVVLDSQENYLTTLTDSRINSYSGVCTDGGNVFVSGWYSKDIVQISPDLKTLGVVGSVDNAVSLCPGVVGSVDNAVSLCFCQKKSWLVVTHRNVDMITIFELD